MYAQQVFTDLLGAPQATNTFRLDAVPIFSEYYASSFVDDIRIWTKNAWLNKLWAVRQKKGKDFTDRALFYTYKTWSDPTADEKNFDTFFSIRFRYGMHVVSNDIKDIEEINTILASAN
jgi:hypothetical protein